MKVIATILLVFFLKAEILYSQTTDYNIGARSKGVGNSNSNIADEWSIFNNVGGISGVENGTVFFGYDRYYGINGFNKVAVGAIQPIKWGNIGLSAVRFGDDLYNEQIASAAFGNKIGFVRLGLRVNYFQMRIADFGTAGAMFFDIGGIVELIPKLTFAAYISNFTLSELNNTEKTKLPVVMKAGISYKPIDALSLFFDIYKDVEYDPVFKAGIEYIVIQKVYLRTGLNTNPFKSFFGLGVDLGRFNLGYAVSTHEFLGTSHQASVSFTYQKKQ